MTELQGDGQVMSIWTSEEMTELQGDGQVMRRWTSEEMTELQGDGQVMRRWTSDEEMDKVMTRWTKRRHISSRWVNQQNCIFGAFRRIKEESLEAP